MNERIIKWLEDHPRREIRYQYDLNYYGIRIMAVDEHGRYRTVVVSSCALYEANSAFDLMNLHAEILIESLE